MHSFVKNNTSEYKKAKDINKNIVTEIGHEEYKAVLSNKNVQDMK